MSQLQIPTINPALNQIVGDLRTQYETQLTAYNAIAKRGKKNFVNGKGERIPSKFRRPTGITAHQEGGSFNAPGTPRYDDMYVYPLAVSLAYDLSGRVIRNMNAGSEYSQIEGLSDYLADIAAALQKDIERNMWGNGQGSRAIATSSAAGVLTCQSAAAATYGATKGATHLEIGETYDIINSSTGAVRGQFRVTAKTATTATGVYSGMADADVSSGDFVVPQGGYLNFPRGFAYGVNNDTGIFQALSRATYAELKSSVVDLAGASQTVSDFNQAVSFLQIRGDVLGPQTGVGAWMPVAQEANMLRLGQNLKRFNGTDTKFDGSFQTFGYGNLTMNICKDMDEDRTYFCRADDMFNLEEMPFGTYDLDGNQLRMKLGTAGVGSDAYVGALGVQFNIGWGQPRMHTLIKRAAIAGLPTEVAAFS